MTDRIYPETAGENPDEARVWKNFGGDYCGNEFQKLNHLIMGKNTRFDHIAEREMHVYGTELNYNNLPYHVRSMVEAVDCLVDRINDVLSSNRPLQEKMEDCTPYVEDMAYVMGLEESVKQYTAFFESIPQMYERMNSGE